MTKDFLEKVEEIKNGKLVAFFVSDAKRVAKLSTRILSTPKLFTCLICVTPRPFTTSCVNVVIYNDCEN